jgi:hypothetical protein
MGLNRAIRSSTKARRFPPSGVAARALLIAAASALATGSGARGHELTVCNYQVYPGSWLNTGFQVRAGQTIEVQASGTNRYKDGQRIEFGVGGDMYGVWSLTVKVGSQIDDLDGGAIFTAEQNGVIELGVPAKADLPVEESGEYLDPAYSLCVNLFIAGQSGGLSATLFDCPAEVWVDYGRPSMACTICITGARTNTPEPVVVDCPNAINSWGDHEDPGGDPFKLIRIFACGAQAATYDWAGQTCGADGAPGYPWGIFVSAPRQDLENYTQPGRRRPICLGTNPVKLRVSQGEDSAEVVIAPQIVLQAGLVGGGGSYENVTECDGDDGTGGGGGGGGGGAGGCGLGVWWEETENIWRGTWRRRGGSSVFDAHFETPGYPPIDQILTMSTYQNQVHIFREGPTACNSCEYDGTFSPDGRTVSGSYSCNDCGNVIGPVPWSATIHCH